MGQVHDHRRAPTVMLRASLRQFEHAITRGRIWFSTWLLPVGIEIGEMGDRVLIQ